MQLDLFWTDCGFYPTTEEGLAVLTNKEKLKKSCPAWTGYGSRFQTDAWGRPVNYEGVKDGYVLRSLGRDGKTGGEGLDADLEEKSSAELK